MLLRSILLGISFVVLLYFASILIPKIKSKYHIHKERKEKVKRLEEFKKKMTELEIK